MQNQKANMSFINVLAIGIGSIVGAGIFALLGQVILISGSLTYVSFLLAGLAAIFSGYSYAKLSAKFPVSGGLTDFFHIAFKNRLLSGGLTILYMLTSAISISMMAKSFGIYAAHLFEHYGHTELIINTAAILLITSMAFLNMLGAADSSRTETLLVALKLFILLTLAGTAFYYFREPAQNIFFPQAKSFLGGVGVTFFAYAGYGVITNAAGDVKNPERTIPLAIYATLLIVMALYCSLAFVVLHFVDFSELTAHPNVAVAIAAKKLLGNLGFDLIYLTIFIAYATGVNATYFSIFRISRALSEDRELPAFYREKFWRFGTRGNLLTTALIVLATLLFDFNAIVNLSSGAFLVCYLAVFCAAWLLRQDIKASPIIIGIGFCLMLFIFVAFLYNIFA
ncbi:MAG: APC family permease [Acetobacter sp.]|nr:APC family permease [Acetobacter sp.]